MNGVRRIGVAIAAGSMMLTLAACSRTSDGTVVLPKAATIPTIDLAPAGRFVPSWMKRNEPTRAAHNFPPAPEKKTPPRRKTQAPVVSSGSGNLACKTVNDGTRVRMVCS
ncbi:hypothetical protein ABUE31_18785 [Mesorhizobium sp. ZMM04-5]|uniref:Lipoprotein n=1 Tax=Mesorhizobium marinum TaxID=3228790 RepID=A0ABV3R5K3_9HYPH